MSDSHTDPKLRQQDHIETDGGLWRLHEMQSRRRPWPYCMCSRCGDGIRAATVTQIVGAGWTRELDWDNWLCPGCRSEN